MRRLLEQNKLGIEYFQQATTRVQAGNVWFAGLAIPMAARRGDTRSKSAPLASIAAAGPPKGQPGRKGG